MEQTESIASLEASQQLRVANEPVDQLFDALGWDSGASADLDRRQLPGLDETEHAGATHTEALTCLFHREKIPRVRRPADPADRPAGLDGVARPLALARW